MWEGIPLSGVVTAGSPWALLTVFVLLIATGKLIPRSSHLETVKDRDEWREACRVSEEARIAQSEQVERLIDQLETVQGMDRTLRDMSARQRSGNAGGWYG